MDVERARYNMVEQQIRTWEVLDQQVLDLLFTVRRRISCRPNAAASHSSTWKYPGAR
jgi:protein-L-isoaspartate(D-aspartate) O-methyltransferase